MSFASPLNSCIWQIVLNYLFFNYLCEVNVKLQSIWMITAILITTGKYNAHVLFFFFFYKAAVLKCLVSISFRVLKVTEDSTGILLKWFMSYNYQYLSLKIKTGIFKYLLMYWEITRINPLGSNINNIIFLKQNFF